MREFLGTMETPPPPAPSDARAAHEGAADPMTPSVDALRRGVADLRAAHPSMPPEGLDAAALRAVALAHPTASRHELRLAIGAGSAAIAAATVADAARYASALVARALADPAVRQARAEAARRDGGTRAR